MNKIFSLILILACQLSYAGKFKRVSIINTTEHDQIFDEVLSVINNEDIEDKFSYFEEFKGKFLRATQAFFNELYELEDGVNRDHLGRLSVFYSNGWEYYDTRLLKNYLTEDEKKLLLSLRKLSGRYQDILHDTKTRRELKFKKSIRSIFYEIESDENLLLQAKKMDLIKEGLSEEKAQKIIEDMSFLEATEQDI